MTGVRLTADPAFTPYQAAFFERFVSEMHPGSSHLLIAPPGSGKAFAVGGTVSELFKAGRLKRVLIISPATLTEQWADIMGRRGHESIVVNARVLRVLRQQSGDSSENWPEGTYAISVDLAKRLDVQKALLSTPWDLVIVDQAQRITGQRLQLLEQISGPVLGPAILMTSPVPITQASVVTSNPTIIDWGESVAELRSRILVPLISKTQTYRSTPEELEIGALLINCALQLGQPRGPLLLKRASSSISCLEVGLIRWFESSSAEPGHLGSLGEVLQLVEQLQIDSRLDCFKELVDELTLVGARQLLVFCEFRDTLDYLTAAVDQGRIDVLALHGGVSEAARQEMVQHFSEQGGILITTLPGLPGLEVECSAAIHYDLPTSRFKFALRESRYDSLTRKQRCTVYFFSDEASDRSLDDRAFAMVHGLRSSASGLDRDIAEDYWDELKIEAGASQA